ncbi:CocE/NonD family hydrolase [Leptobacterium sp. I13]|uniref:CocE/NonD family hydrolase n=1 Tax=Leptobacterium meishanense TaxID=3128904 RepID=UPI0030EE7676
MSKINNSITLGLTIIAFIITTNLRAQQTAIEDIQVSYYQKVPMRDGINLSANVFKPKDLKEPLPAIMVLTPYNNDHNTERGIYFSTNGYVFVSVDARGRGDSEGTFIPFENEGKDGYDAIEWIAKQPWCNGKVAAMGGSYKGMVQWLTAKEHPPHLTTMVPTATIAPGIDATWTNNISHTYNLNILSYVAGKITNTKNFFSSYNMAKIDQYYRDHDFPYINLLDAIDSPDKKMQTIFKRWLSHPTFDSYWKNILPKMEDYKKMDIPILTITGYFDGDLPGTFYYYNNYQKYATQAKKDKTYMIIGPWDHSGTRRPVDKLGGLDFGEKSVIDIFELHKEWFDYTMKDSEKPEFLKDHITYFKIGPDEWDYVPDLESLSNEKYTYYLSSPNSNPQDIFNSGLLMKTPVNEKDADFVIYDPLEPRILIEDGTNYLTTQTYINEKGRLFYHSPILNEAIELSGFMELNLFAEINTPDTDLEFRVYEIKEDGTSVWLGSGIMRARFRNSNEVEELIIPGSVNEYRMKSWFMLNRTLSKGSRIRLMFGYLDSPEYQKNYNSGKDVSLETSKDARTATIKLYKSKKYPSRLVLPVKIKK